MKERERERKDTRAPNEVTSLCVVPSVETNQRVEATVSPGSDYYCTALPKADSSSGVPCWDRHEPAIQRGV